MIPAPLVEPYRQYEGAADDVHDLRLRVFAAETDVQLAKDELGYVESTIWLTVEGRNAEERKANFVIICERNEEYQSALLGVRAKQHVLNKVQADLERALDRKRGWGWVVRSVASVNAPSAFDD